MSGQETRKLMHTPRHRCGKEASLLRAIKPYPTPINFLWHCSQSVHDHKGQDITILTKLKYNVAKRVPEYADQNSVFLILICIHIHLYLRVYNLNSGPKTCFGQIFGANHLLLGQCHLKFRMNRNLR